MDRSNVTDEGRFSREVYNFGGASFSSSCIIRPDSDVSDWDAVGTLESYPKNHVLLERDRCRTGLYRQKRHSSRL